MKILIFCTAHNSLSQRLCLVLAKSHTISIEYALSDDVMIEAAELFQPDIIISPFLTSRIPQEVYQKYLSLIVHPGPPGDAGPSSLDWLLIGDDGTEEDPSKLLNTAALSESGRPYWGVTVLQAIEEFDEGPVWAYDQFPINIDDVQITKSTLYRGAVTRAAVAATLAAVDRIEAAALLSPAPAIIGKPGLAYPPSLVPDPTFKSLSVTEAKPFLGGKTHQRPLLKAAQRDFDVKLHNAKEISRRIRCSDSQPGCLSSILGQNLYLYGGAIEEGQWVQDAFTVAGAVIGCRAEAVCFATCDKKGIWITHLRRMKRKQDPQLWPKIPAVSCLLELQLMNEKGLEKLTIPPPALGWLPAQAPTLQEIWVEFSTVGNGRRVAYVFSEIYNGAMSTSQCSQLIKALDYVLSTHTEAKPLSAVVLMGGAAYFSNGIHLNVIETAPDPAIESWRNINRINDVVFYLLHEFPRRNILTIAAMRGNAAAGGVALATACDKVVAGNTVVLNPAYRALGLYGSEYHTLSYNQRCGSDVAKTILRSMLPLSAHDAESLGLVDCVLPSHGAELTDAVRHYVASLMESPEPLSVSWKEGIDMSLAALTHYRVSELGEMAKDFWSPRSVRYHRRRNDFVRKAKAKATPLRFATHRKIAQDGELFDEEEKDEFDLIAKFETRSQQKIEAAVYQKLFGDRGVTFPCYYDA